MIIFGVDMCSLPHIDHKKKYILILGKGPTQGLEHTLTTKELSSINVTKKNTKFRVRPHYNGPYNYLFVNGTKIIKFKAKDSEVTAYPLFRKNFKELVSR